MNWDGLVVDVIAFNWCQCNFVTLNAKRNFIYSYVSVPVWYMNEWSVQCVTLCGWTAEKRMKSKYVQRATENYTVCLATLSNWIMHKKKENSENSRNNRIWLKSNYLNRQPKQKNVFATPNTQCLCLCVHCAQNDTHKMWWEFIVWKKKRQNREYAYQHLWWLFVQTFQRI